MGSITIRRRLATAAAATAVALLTLAACSSGSGSSSSAATSAASDGSGTSGATTGSAAGAYGYGDQATSGPSATSGSSGSSSGAAGALATRSTSLGTVVVAGNGMTVYQYDKDTQGSGSSTCSGQCATLWPPVHAGTGTPQADGVTGKVGTITGTDGQPQLTLDGWPLYYYAGDQAAGDTKGQGVGGIWWVLTPAGQRITG